MARSLPAFLKPKAPTHASKKFKAMSDSKKLTTIEDLLRKQKARSSGKVSCLTVHLTLFALCFLIHDFL